MDDKQLEAVNKYWDSFNKGYYAHCKSLIRWYVKKNSITIEMFDKAFKVKAFELCENIICCIDETLITAKMFWEAFEHGVEAFELCEYIIEHIDISLITVEMFDKALEVKAYFMCEAIIRHINKDLITIEMFKKVHKHGNKAFDVCKELAGRVGFGFLVEGL